MGALIKLTQGKIVLIDSEDFEFLNQWKWYYRDGYAVRNSNRKTIWMHRLINKTPDNLFTDHINRNTLDNRKINLRSVTVQENNSNRSKMKNNTSGFRGVFYSKDHKKFRAVFQKKHLGYFPTALEASKAYERRVAI